MYCSNICNHLLSIVLNLQNIPYHMGYKPMGHNQPHCLSYLKVKPRICQAYFIFGLSPPTLSSTSELTLIVNKYTKYYMYTFLS